MEYGFILTRGSGDAAQDGSGRHGGWIFACDIWILRFCLFTYQ